MSLLNNIRFRVSRKLSYFLLYHRFKGVLLLRKELCSRLVPPTDGPIICSTLFDIDILVDPVIDKGLERQIYYFGVYEAGTISVLSKFLHQGDAFLDVGANIEFLNERKGRVDYTQLIKEPTSSLYPVSPKKKLNVLIAGILGLMAFTMLVFFLESIEKQRAVRTK